MEHSHLPKHIIFTVIEGQLFMEHSEALTYLDLPRTTFNRMVKNLALLEDGDVICIRTENYFEQDLCMTFGKMFRQRNGVVNSIK